MIRKPLARTLLLPAALTLFLGTPLAAAPQDSHAKEHKEHEHEVPEHSFADVKAWARVFDNPTRDDWQLPEEVVAAMGLEAGSVVAEIGAGTGYFVGHLAGAVVPGGRVLAIDIEANMVEHMRKRAEEEGVAGVEVILAAPDDPKIPPASADRILLVDTYHHIHDRVGYLNRLQAALAPKGQVVVIDFFKRQLPVGPPPQHKLSREQVVEEFGEAGYRLAAEEKFLPYQYFLSFEPTPE